MEKDLLDIKTDSISIDEINCLDIELIKMLFTFFFINFDFVI